MKTIMMIMMVFCCAGILDNSGQNIDNVITILGEETEYSSTYPTDPYGWEE